MASKLLVVGLVSWASLLGGVTARLSEHPKFVKVDAEDEYVSTNSYIIEMAKGQTMESLMENSDLETEGDFSKANVRFEYTNLFPERMVYAVHGVSDEAVSMMLDSSTVHRVHEDAQRFPSIEPNPGEGLWTDELVRQTNAPWGLDRIDSRALNLDGNYDYNFDGTGVTIFIADDGVLPTHQEFTGRYVDCTDFTDLGCTVGNGDWGSHGTHVAGTAAGTTWGVAKGALIRDLRVLGPRGGFTSWVIAALDHVVGLKRADPSAKFVINMSLGGPFGQEENTAVDRTVQAGITVVVAAGNENQDACNVSPASARMAITVASSTRTDQRSDFSNWGRCVDIFAPGSGIESASNANNMASVIFSGTSMASPHTAGVAALLLQQDIDPRTMLTATATPNVISDLQGSPNLFLFNGFKPIPTTPTVMPTPPPTRDPTPPPTAAPVVPTTPPTVAPTAAPTPFTCPPGDSVFTLTLFTDFFAEETAWSLINQCDTFYRGVNFENYDDATFYVVNGCIISGDQFKFAIFDRFGDGICCGQYGNGYYTISVDGKEVARGGEFEFSEVTTFGAPCPTPAPTTAAPTPAPTNTTAAPTPVLTVADYLYKIEAVFGSSIPVDLPSPDEVAGILHLTANFYRQHISTTVNIPLQSIVVSAYNEQMNQLSESEVALFESKTGSIGAFEFDGQLVDLALSRMDDSQKNTVLGDDQHQSVYQFRLWFNTRVTLNQGIGPTIPTKEEVGRGLASYDMDDYLSRFANAGDGAFVFANAVIMLVHM